MTSTVVAIWYARDICGGILNPKSYNSLLSFKFQVMENARIIPIPKLLEDRVHTDRDKKKRHAAAAGGGAAAAAAPPSMAAAGGADDWGHEANNDYTYMGIDFSSPSPGVRPSTAIPQFISQHTDEK